MDLTEKFLKLAALGWDGKEDEFKFMERTFRIKSKIISKKSETRCVLIITYYRENIFGRVEIRLKKEEIPDIIKHYLSLFRTVDGVIYGPSAENMKINQDWT